MVYWEGQGKRFEEIMADEDMISLSYVIWVNI